MRSGKLRLFSTSENVPKAKDNIRLRYMSQRYFFFFRKTESFITMGQGSSGEVLVPKIDYVLGHFFMWICFNFFYTDFNCVLISVLTQF